MEKTLTPRTKKQLLAWLLTGCIMIFIMVIIGGITRLTGSGLSIVEWNVIMGAIPPLNEADWQLVFEKYKQFPQYQKMNYNMGLEEFKYIFFWEYLHRLWGRLIGIVFIIPFAFFLVKKMLNKRWIKQLTIIFILGGLQGLVGWIMVKSGLVDVPWVSPYRLALHLSLALFLYCYLLWLVLELIFARQAASVQVPEGVKKLSYWILGVLVLQIIFGGFMAGLKAASFYPSWPDMHGAYVPENLFAVKPFWKNFFENPATVQFLHRNIAYLLTFMILFFWIKVKISVSDGRVKAGANLLLLITMVQVMLGIITIVNSVGRIPIVWGVAHQGVAVLLLSASVYLVFLFSRASSSEVE